MTWRLEQDLICGDLNNIYRNTLKGSLRLRGRSRPILLTLTGNARGDLAGRWLRFAPRHRGRQSEAPATADSLPTQEETKGQEFGAQQIGPVAHAEIRSDGSLCLEWFGPEGQVTIELPDPVIEFFDDDDGSEPDDNELAAIEDDLTVEWEPPPELQTSVGGRQAKTGLDLAADWKPDVETLQQWELMDEIFEGRNEIPLRSLFADDWPFPLEASLSDQEVEARVVDVLAVLAAHNIAVELCQHFDPRGVYRMLIDNIIAEEWTHPRQRETGFITHYTGWTHCETCSDELRACCSEL